MSEEQLDTTEVDETIVEVEGVPKTSDSPISRRELISFQAVIKILGELVKGGGELAEQFVRAKVAQESNLAAKTAAEAAELSSRMEENESKANVLNQEALKLYVSNLESILKLPPEGQVLAILKMMSDDPALEEQIDRISDILQRLRLLNGTFVGLANMRLIDDSEDPPRRE